MRWVTPRLFFVPCSDGAIAYVTNARSNPVSVIMSMQKPADSFYAASKNALLEALPYSMRCKTGYGIAPEG